GQEGGEGGGGAGLVGPGGGEGGGGVLGKVEDTKGDARTNFERLRAWNEERAVRAARESSTPLDTIGFFECDSEKAWLQLLGSVLESRHDVVVDALFGTGLTR